jgi:hypothetical protein
LSFLTKSYPLIGHANTVGFNQDWGEIKREREREKRRYEKEGRTRDVRVRK